ncbi:hypothetical protein PGTUg99_026989 [Puccinia graminis f. sp. tritici]|uniref:Uncharacterized protein n=1 Tax=Puccinia graminis f. sp. tritici TaxID=56615 RepID=A0A5B0RY79_PUCGR|nr:hypothetical protein PGTUg99_026989 [Puccinia graminis f. sp. tritici]
MKRFLRISAVFLPQLFTSLVKSGGPPREPCSVEQAEICKDNHKLSRFASTEYLWICYSSAAIMVWVKLVNQVTSTDTFCFCVAGAHFSRSQVFQLDQRKHPHGQGFGSSNDVEEPLSGGVASDWNLDLSLQHGYEPISLKTQIREIDFLGMLTQESLDHREKNNAGDSEKQECETKGFHHLEKDDMGEEGF